MQQESVWFVMYPSVLPELIVNELFPIGTRHDRHRRWTEVGCLGTMHMAGQDAHHVSVRADCLGEAGVVVEALRVEKRDTHLHRRVMQTHECRRRRAGRQFAPHDIEWCAMD
jgi:hypothetical protein